MKYLFIFMVGSLIGWVIELLFRRFVSAKKWMNPGFLSGPYLPIYGFGLCIMYFFCSLSFAWYFKILVIGALLTGIEYITGLIYIKFFKIRLWDYSKRLGNIGGIISIDGSLIWLALAAVFLFLLYPLFEKMLIWLSGAKYFLLVMGIFYGVIIVDIFESFSLAIKIRSVAAKEKDTIAYEKLKLHIAQSEWEKGGKRSFLFPFRSNESPKEHAEKFMQKNSKKNDEEALDTAATPNDENGLLPNNDDKPLPNDEDGHKGDE